MARMRLIDQAVSAYDHLIIDHGYTHERLEAIQNRLQARGMPRPQVWRYFVRLWRAARLRGIRFLRSTTALDELLSYYDREQALMLLSEIRASRRKYARRKKIREEERYG